MPDLIRTVDILRHLHDGGVEFIVIGGAAVIAHGSSLMTQDLDLCAPLTEVNCIRIINAVQPFHPRWRMRPDLPEIKPDNPNLSGLTVMYLRTDLGQIDILGEVPEVCSYAELAAAAGRDRDLIAIRQLEVIKVERAKRREKPES